MSRGTIRWCLVGISLTLAAAALATAPPRKAARTAWGPYTVVSTATMTGEPSAEVTIRDATGRSVRRIDDAMVDSVRLLRLDERRAPDLLVTTFSGGAHCCFTLYAFSREGGVRNLFVFWGGETEDPSAVLDAGDGRKALVFEDIDPLAYAADLPFSVTPDLALVLGPGPRPAAPWRDVTRQFPQVIERVAQRHLADFVKGLRETASGRQEDPGYSELELRAAAEGFYANMVLLNREAQARAWLLPLMKPDTAEWFAASAAEIRAAALRDRNARITRNNAPVLIPW